LKVLLDENLSPRLIPHLAALGVFASHVAHLGRAGLSDATLWRLAFETDTVVVTINARDFLLLARDTDLHPGLIVLRLSGLSAEDQWRHLEPAVRLGMAEEHAGRTLINRVIEISGVGDLRLQQIPGDGI
jgi:predicted nuclease of predicted toxin-antitoxin system